MALDDAKRIDSLERENRMLRESLRQHDKKEIEALQAAQETKRTAAAQQTTMQEIQLTGEELEKSRMGAWLAWHLQKQVKEGRGSEVFNFELVRKSIAPNTWPPGDSAANYTKLVEVKVAESGVRVPDFANTTLGKMLAARNAWRKS